MLASQHVSQQADGMPACPQRDLLAANSACQHSAVCRMAVGMIVAIVNSKGGVGKSTLAGSLAGWLHAQGHQVILADCDTQQSSSEWISEAIPTLPMVRLTNADQVLDELPVLAREADFVIADGPGSQTETSRALLMWADLAVIPCKASMFEARALDKNTNFVRQAQAIRQGPPSAVAVLSMVGREYRLTRDMLDAAQALTTLRRQHGGDSPAGLCRCAGPGDVRVADGLRRTRCRRRN